MQPGPMGGSPLSRSPELWGSPGLRQARPELGQGWDFQADPQAPVELGMAGQGARSFGSLVSRGLHGLGTAPFRSLPPAQPGQKGAGAGGFLDLSAPCSLGDNATT